MSSPPQAPRPRSGLVFIALALCALSAGAHGQSPARSHWLDSYRETVGRLMKAATADDFAWRRLAELTDTFGNRLSGSDNLTRAIAWSADVMRRDALENVRTEEVMVPRWVRGRESLEIVEPQRDSLAMLGLGGSVGTAPGGLEAQVLVVSSFDDLRARASEARGRIVLFNAPFTSYAETVTYRTMGARSASQAGAVAVLVRAIGPTGLRTPHTGSVNYGQGVAPIPAAAISAEDTDRVARLSARAPVRLRLMMEARTEADVPSANVVGEIRGRERPDEIVLIGGHLDSWDVGTGASDDGVGCIVTWEAARLMTRLGIRPRRTVRVVLFTNEENGLRGATGYLEKYRAEAANHVFALESDSGVFAPAGLGFSGSPLARDIVRDISSMFLAQYGFSEIAQGGGGADVGPIAQAANAPTMALLGNPARYFQIHHTPADTIERITVDEVQRAVVAVTVMTYVIAEMPERLPR